ncbi:2-keto-4-pentenoate hydratase [Pseudonocardia spinosispora]|uniref:2-keto-4-pentenoate hydratase n=1 Tax=Pseudonocardia spinosispora TaxID=103441 RepID=UPI00040644ED|nr:fumarylacetoacetate hydrolase family protein [Pseudonocardia spinosispora]
MTSALTDPELHVLAADRLRQAAADRTPCAPIRDLLPDGEATDPADQMEFGYAVQRLLTSSSLESGRRIVGSKIGLTAPAVQAQLGVDRPDLGILYEDMAFGEGETIPMSRLLQPKVEAEVGFVLGADLDRDDLTLDVVRDAVRSVVASLEIVDSRIADWNIRLVDTVADNASCGVYVLGSQHLSLDGLDLPGATMSMTANGEVVSEGAGSACMGDPCIALQWLAETARRFGTPLRAGDVILSGALGPMVPAQPDTTYEATITGLGTVRATFGPA